MIFEMRFCQHLNLIKKKHILARTSFSNFEMRREVTKNQLQNNMARNENV